jgi:translation initiation factor 2 beta subunit (eIF-2beta)/eIF-5
MAFSNMNGSADPFYRYKIPVMEIKHQNKKTVIENINAISKQLDRPVSYLEKWFSKELSTSAKIAESRYLVLKGIHEKSKVIDVLFKFIKFIVLCRVCKNPETTISIKAKNIYLDCKACGAYLAITGDQHTLVKFICRAYEKPIKKFKFEPTEYVEEDWSCDTSEAAVKSRMIEFFGEKKQCCATPKDNPTLMYDDDDDTIVFDDAPRRLSKRSTSLDELIDAL